MANETSLLLPATASPDGNGDTKEDGAAVFVLCNAVKEWIFDIYSKNQFVIHIASAIGFAKVYPPLGAIYVYPSITATWIAVIFIFGMAGLSLKYQELSNAANRIRFNLFIQTFNFGVISSVVYSVSRILMWLEWITESLADGMVISACMPITITMVIVLTKSANGDEAAAILNAAVGCLLGVIVSPFLILTYIGVRADIDMIDVFWKLCLRVLAPIAVGQILQQYSRRVVTFVELRKQHFKTCQEWALVFIVYAAFCKTFSPSSSSQQVTVQWSSVLVMAIAQVTCLFFCMWLAWMSLNVCFPDELRLQVMGIYGCTHKSVSVGIPLLNAIYENDPNLGIYTLPLLIWHPAQIMIGSTLAPYLAKKVKQLEG
jgi:solute carrier family 10 (sodium/bile acid cotransporter), member 7